MKKWLKLLRPSRTVSYAKHKIHSFEDIKDERKFIFVNSCLLSTWKVSTLSLTNNNYNYLGWCSKYTSAELALHNSGKTVPCWSLMESLKLLGGKRIFSCTVKKCTENSTIQLHVLLHSIFSI